MRSISFSYGKILRYVRSNTNIADSVAVREQIIERIAAEPRAGLSDRDAPDRRFSADDRAVANGRNIEFPRAYFHGRCRGIADSGNCEHPVEESRTAAPVRRPYERLNCCDLITKCSSWCTLAGHEHTTRSMPSADATASVCLRCAATHDASQAPGRRGFEHPWPYDEDTWFHPTLSLPAAGPFHQHRQGEPRCDQVEILSPRHSRC